MEVAKTHGMAEETRTTMVLYVDALIRCRTATREAWLRFRDSLQVVEFGACVARDLSPLAKPLASWRPF